MQTESQVDEVAGLHIFRDPALRDVELMRAYDFPLQLQTSILEDAYGLHLVERGPGHFRYRGFGGDSPPGRMLVVEPGEPLLSSMSAPGLLTGRVITVSAARMREAWLAVGGSAAAHPVFPVPLITDPDFVSAFVAAHVAFSEAAPLLARDVALARLLEVLLVRYADRERHTVVRRQERLAVRRARAFLEAHACAAVRLDEVSEAVGLSKFHLAHAFQKEVGIPLHQYQLALRIDRAKQLLARGTHPGQVAVTLGFADQSHLNRLFKRMVGVTPGVYQRTAVGGAAARAQRAAVPGQVA
ncbi:MULTISPECIES: AraC family transcriptional regulator [Myxococcaceae]|uniref:AraC family transcriptional regulator n=1 Tax=Myxococcaceae TaxID=31 RepID=UPI0018903666|nr:MULTISPECIES: AraC family transcriptional regulator [Myxococcaceae]MBF5043781.1 helix-turn-helix transcriptional regulator [Simulacricoccus sp. 17bor-14]